MVNTLSVPTAEWPERGRCGACGRDARRYPSTWWEHVGPPCQARSQTIWPVDDADIQAAVRFIPGGESLPTAPDRPMVDNPTITVREWLARGARRTTTRQTLD